MTRQVLVCIRALEFFWPSRVGTLVIVVRRVLQTDLVNFMQARGTRSYSPHTARCTPLARGPRSGSFIQSRTPLGEEGGGGAPRFGGGGIPIAHPRRTRPITQPTDPSW